MQEREQKYRQTLEFWNKPGASPYDQVMAAICEIKLRSYATAKERCFLALQGYLRERRFWLMGSRPELLVETSILAGVSSPWDGRVAKEVSSYRLDYRGDSAIAHYAYALVELAQHADEQTETHVPQLTRVRRDAWLSSIGQTIEAISRRNQQGFDTALVGLLEAHKRMAKFGAIRESPEGFVSLAGTCLSKLALDRGMRVEVNSEYLPIEYLRYLQAFAQDGTPTS